MVRTICLNEQIARTENLGLEWVIPIDSSKAIDGHITTDKFKNWRKEKVQ